MVRGTVTAEAGRLGTQPLFAIGDASGGIIVRLPDEATAPQRGSVIQVAGKLADPYGQLEVRPGDGDIDVTGSGALPSPIQAPSGGLDESTEARLVTASGVLAAKPSKSGNSIVLTLERSGQASVRVMADSTSGVTASSFEVGATYRVTGIGGQRASRKGALDGYRLWLRGTADVQRLAGPPAGGSTPEPGGGTAAPKTITIGAALRKGQGTVAVDGVVTAPATLLDATGRRIVVQDQSAAIEVLLPVGASAPPIATRLHVEGTVKRAYGAPRLQATKVTLRGSGAVPAPMELRSEPGEDHEWELVRIHGPVASVHKLGDRWRAEIRLGGRQVVVVGQAGAGIAVDTLAEDRIATVTGIVRRPYPTASDQRFTILPRYPADVRVTGSAAAAGSTNSQGAGHAATPVPQRRRRPPPRATRSQRGRDIDLAGLADAVGEQVRVGGLVTDLEPRGIRIDDGTASALVVLEGDAAQLLPLIEPADALNASGTVESVDGELAVVGHRSGRDRPCRRSHHRGSRCHGDAHRRAIGRRPDQRDGGESGRPARGLPGLAGLGTACRGHGALGRRHMPPAVAGAAPSRSPRRGPSGRLRRGSDRRARHHRRAVAGPAGRPRPDPRSGHARLSTSHARRDSA